MTKILVVYTGGTFGSVETKDEKKISENPAVNVVAIYNRLNPGWNVTFEEDHVTKILSENLTISYWNCFIAKLKTIPFQEYDGVIITHGTDTLAYSAALLSVLLNHIEIPVVLVSSNEPLTSLASNGYKNFEDAVNFIRHEAGKNRGVFVAYSYDLRRTMIYPGKHITQSQPFTNRFECFDGIDLGFMENGKFCVENLEAAQKRMGKNGCDNANILDGVSHLDHCVLLIHPYVGLDYSHFNLDKITAVLHRTYHSFTMCVGENEREMVSGTSAKQFLSRCRVKGIPLYFTSFDRACTPYQSTSAMHKEGAEFLLNTSVELAYAQLLIGHSIQKSKGKLSDELIKKLKIQFLEEPEY